MHLLHVPFHFQTVTRDAETQPVRHLILQAIVVVFILILHGFAVDIFIFFAHIN
jgi:hypothetical protein